MLPKLEQQQQPTKKNVRFEACHQFVTGTLSLVLPHYKGNSKCNQQASAETAEKAKKNAGGQQHLHPIEMHQQPQQPPREITKKFNGETRMYYFLATVNTFAELDKYREQNDCRFNGITTEQKKIFTSTTLPCTRKRYWRKYDLKCEFELRAERPDLKSGIIHIYRHAEHNHAVQLAVVKTRKRKPLAEIHQNNTQEEQMEGEEEDKEEEDEVEEDEESEDKEEFVNDADKQGTSTGMKIEMNQHQHPYSYRSLSLPKPKETTQEPCPKRQKLITEIDMDHSLINDESSSASAINSLLDGKNIEQWKMAALEAKNQILERQLEDRKLGAQVCKLQTKNHAINLENTELKAQLEATTEEFQQLKAQNHVLVKENEALKEKAVNYKQKEDKMKKEHEIDAGNYKFLNRRQNMEMSEFKAKYQKLMETNVAFEEKLQKANDKLKETIQTNQQKMEEKLSSLKANNLALIEAKRALKLKETKHDQMVMAKNKEIDEIIKSSLLRQNEIAELKAKNQQLHEASVKDLRMAKDKFEKDQQKNHKKRWDDFAEKLKLQKEQHQGEIAELKKKNEQLMEQNETLEQQLKIAIKMDEFAKNLTSVNEEQQKEIAELKAHYKELEVKNEAVEEKLKIANEELKTATKKNEEMSKDMQGFANTIGKYKNQ